MNRCVLIFVLIFLIILFFIIMGFCVMSRETFTMVEPQYKKKAKEIIGREIDNNFSFDVVLLKDYYQNNIDACVYVEINDEGDYRVVYANSLKGSDKIKYFLLLMKKVKDKYGKLPKCVFVQTFADRQIQKDLCILENSALSGDRALLSPLWYFYSKGKVDDVKDSRKPWSEKKSMAVWRGATTGFAMNEFRAGQRVSRKYIVDVGKRYPELINAEFTSFADKGKHLQQEYKKAIFMTPLEQTDYKYIISTDGNGGTYGLYWVLSSGSLCLNNSFYKQWFTPFFQKDKHFVEFDDSCDKGNLERVVESVKEHDTRSLRIALNAKVVSDNIFNEDFVVYYMYEILCFYAQKQGL